MNGPAEVEELPVIAVAANLPASMACTSARLMTWMPSPKMFLSMAAANWASPSRSASSRAFWYAGWSVVGLTGLVELRERVRVRERVDAGRDDVGLGFLEGCVGGGRIALSRAERLQDVFGRQGDAHD